MSDEAVDFSVIDLRFAFFEEMLAQMDAKLKERTT
jgi:hypothetical protein